ncbi:MAG: valine--tRNA ligase [Candidatus Taylorbacteria bacterium RIFCSPLOWO2_12_FULL_47_20]|uniref:Valine--tRNA ligase n=2 Tax=Candidatus Tayloriibacteriota TaxID=1817919 RepID=A0A1G2P5R5_9BACT|nr:MAG: valine--tRNA ligase [Candidatus Taylorbacteria bacterium RIFCSPLOWO2_02_FULL_46_40]OHA43686.1 MAG: valine--tRNA ligase [Candidatus Taylorbacteria bacterium RIFCSPLOWO2_12_FULL_47_20]
MSKMTTEINKSGDQTPTTDDIPAQFLKPYDSNQTEKRIYEFWEKSGFFNPDVCVKKGFCESDSEAFSMVLPPPNVTGILHMGHALAVTLEDIMVRFARMSGKKTLWIPGTDHAAIATQSKVEKEIYKKEGKNRYEIGREELLKRIEAFAAESKTTIVSQLKSLGASLDWNREAFTLDEKRGKAVRCAFKELYDAGLIYRGYRIVNWDPKGQTTISDDEIVYEERAAKLYTFKYSKDFPVPISTTRPETKLGDTGVAVHPTDARYAKFVGKEYEAEFAGSKLKIKIFADESVDPAFGTGAVGVTPAHSHIDADMALRHGLPSKVVIDERARITEGMDGVKGEKTIVAREKIIGWLEQNGLLIRTEDIKQNIATAERTGGVIEPLPKLQWFVSVNKKFKIRKSKISGVNSGDMVTLKEIMAQAVKSGNIKIIPDHFSKTYFHWIENLRDWCISRQIWYGHQIPVWYSTLAAEGDLNAEQEMYIGIEKPKGEEWEQDPDTLDTWFSASLWTFSTLGWPDTTEDLKVFHPTSVLETGYEILFFWVARMILMSGFFLGEIPFQTVYLHGTVRDKQRQKMSKSLGNGIDPVEMSAKYGADAVRMSLAVGNTPGTDTRISEEKIRGYKHFCNKIWNIGRFVISNTKKADETAPPSILADDEELLRSFSALKSEITDDMNSFRFYMGAEKIYHFVWHELADKFIEKSKESLKGAGAARDSTAYALRKVFLESIKILHPFMPFVTEEIWSMFKTVGENARPLIVEDW